MPVCMGILPLTALAAGDITGKVINKETDDPMDFVTVQARECSYRQTSSDRHQYR